MIGAFPEGQSALTLVAARRRHMAWTTLAPVPSCAGVRTGRCLDQRDGVRRVVVDVNAVVPCVAELSYSQSLVVRLTTARKAALWTQAT